MALENVQTEFKVGPLTINLRVLLEPKGFLRIILLVSSWIGGKELEGNVLLSKSPMLFIPYLKHHK